MERFCILLLVAVVLFIGTEAGVVKKEVSGKELNLAEKLRMLLNEKEKVGFKKEAFRLFSKKETSEESAEASDESQDEAEQEVEGAEVVSNEEEAKFWATACGGELYEYFFDTTEVTEEEVQQNFKNVQGVLTEAQNKLGEHKAEVEKIEADLDGKTLDEFKEDHVKLGTSIVEGFYNVENVAFCAWAKFGILMHRIHTSGSEDRVSCTNFAEYLFKLYSSDQECQGMDVVVKQLGSYLRSDVRCMHAELEQATQTYGETASIVAATMGLLAELGYEYWVFAEALQWAPQILEKYEGQCAVVQENQEPVEKELHTLLGLLKKLQQ